MLGRYTSIIGTLALMAGATGGVGVSGAAAAHHYGHHTRRHASASRSTSPRSSSSTANDPANPETALTGETATKAKEAALAAVPGGTVERASIESPSDPSKAAYEVHVRKSDGSQVEVLLDSSFKVLAINASSGCAGGPRSGSSSTTPA